MISEIFHALWVKSNLGLFMSLKQWNDDLLKSLIYIALESFRLVREIIVSALEPEILTF